MSKSKEKAPTPSDNLLFAEGDLLVSNLTNKRVLFKVVQVEYLTFEHFSDHVYKLEVLSSEFAFAKFLNHSKAIAHGVYRKATAAEILLYGK